MPILVFVAFVLLGPHTAVRCVADDAIREFRGPTMGTDFMVKVFGASEVGDDDIRFRIDGELRRVNDQMSTYLKSSEITRFNQTDSTDWFEVSPEFAAVVQYAQEVAKKTDGAFDITVGPLVNAWSFGTTERTQTVPSEEQLAAIRSSVGFEKLDVRLDPPALKKTVPKLQIDLSAIAKGHGVDRVVDLLAGMGIENVFVEIGGEVRTSGSKAGEAWKVGIQKPDAARNALLIAHPMSDDGGKDESMATSGDYRNVFNVDGIRYSHTIDPRTGVPVQHNVASVTVVAASCMAADAWATALNVVGHDDAKRLAEREGMSVLLVRRVKDSFAVSGTGELAQYANEGMVPAGGVRGAGGAAAKNANSPIAILLLTFVVFSIILVAMAVGVIFSGKSISGSCGGIANQTDENGQTKCGLCSSPSDACRDLRETMQAKQQAV